MSNFKEDILEAVGHEIIEKIIIGELQHYSDDQNAKNRNINFDVPTDWKEVIDYLNYEYENGWGTRECHPIYIYTNTYIYFIREYDGSTAIHRIPRNPINVHVEYDGEYRK